MDSRLRATEQGLNPLEFGADQETAARDADADRCVLIPSNSGLIRKPAKTIEVFEFDVLIPSNSGLIRKPKQVREALIEYCLNPLEFGADQETL